jgi:MFS family permease
MSHVTLPEIEDDDRARRAVPILVWAQAVLGAQMTVHFILGGLAGILLAENKALATLPITMIVLGATLAAPVMSWIMGRWGRRTGFLIGAAAGALGGALAAQAMIAHSFDLASWAYRPRAIAWVLAGGLAAALFGPQLVIWFKDALAPIPYAGAYQAMVVLNLVGIIPLLFLDIPPPPRGPRGHRSGRAWREILSERRIVVAMLCAMVSYALMNLVMTSTPLAMVHHGLGTDDAAGVVRVHVLAMYGPSFISGPLIARYRSPRIIALGLAFLSAGALVALSGTELFTFSVALGLIGVGWNFSFIGATTMLAGAYRPEERARVQGLNDFLVMGMVTLASFSSGALMSQLGWQAVNLAAIPFLLLASAALIWLTLCERTARA